MQHNFVIIVFLLFFVWPYQVNIFLCFRGQALLLLIILTPKENTRMLTMKATLPYVSKYRLKVYKMAFKAQQLRYYYKSIKPL